LLGAGVRALLRQGRRQKAQALQRTAPVLCLPLWREGAAMKHLFLVNPAAGLCDRTAQIKAAANAVLGSRSIPYAIAVSRGPGDLTERARTACAAGEDIRLYACGGDGTLNEVINGAVGFENAVVTHYPAGSG